VGIIIIVNGGKWQEEELMKWNANGKCVIMVMKMCNNNMAGIMKIVANEICNKIVCVDASSNNV